MSQPAFVVLVRIQSSLPREEVMRVMEERKPQFRALSGLIQKFYLHEPGSDVYGGLYLWDSRESIDAYNASELRQTIAKAYQGVGAPRVEIYEVESLLREA